MNERYNVKMNICCICQYFTHTKTKSELEDCIEPQRKEANSTSPTAFPQFWDFLFPMCVTYDVQSSSRIILITTKTMATLCDQ